MRSYTLLIVFLGIFSDGIMPMEYNRNKLKLETPSLEMMTKAALKIVSKNEKEFFLMVCKQKFLKYCIKIPLRVK